MHTTRRTFMKNGVAAFTVGFAAPSFLSDLAHAQGGASRNLVVLYLSGGNDSLTTVFPYNDPYYNGAQSRRPNIAVPASAALQVGTDSSGKAIGIHPRLNGLAGVSGGRARGLHDIFNQGKLAIIQRTGYPNQSRSHFLGTDIWSTALPTNSQGPGWLGRYLDLLPSPVDPLVAWNTQRETPRTLLARTVGVPSIVTPASYLFQSPNSGTELTYERTAAIRISSHVPVDRPHLAFVNSTQQQAFATLDRVAPVATYVATNPSAGGVTYPNNGFAQALKAIAGAISRGVGTKVFWVQTGGFDTHSGMGTYQAGSYFNLMANLNDGLAVFYDDLKNQGLLDQTLILQFSEFGRRISENGSQGTDHGAGAIMMAIGGTVRGGIYGTAASLDPNPANPTLENNGGDVRFETDFRSVYARVLDGWLGANSTAILAGDFRAGGPGIV
jgi:uncharacterized protein (DUF1501 family)